MSTNSSSLYVAAYSNSDPTNITTDWLPVISCTSEIGSPNVRTCGNGILSNTTGTTCYIKLDIQIAYTNIGSVDNPQSVLSAVIFHYQGVVSENLLNCFIFLSLNIYFTATALIDKSIIFSFTCNGKCNISRYIRCANYCTRSNTCTKYSFTS